MPPNFSQQLKQSKPMDFEDLESFDQNDFLPSYNGYQKDQGLLKDYSDDCLLSFENYEGPILSNVMRSNSLVKAGEISSLAESSPPQTNSCNIPVQNASFSDTLNPISSTKASKKEKEEKKEKKEKKDWMRNLYPNVMRTVIKRILQNLEVYDHKLEKIKRKLQQEDLQCIKVSQFKQYCSGLKNVDFYLRDIYSLLNYKEGTKIQKQMKKMLHEFFVWYLEKRYTIEIIKSDQCQFKNLYIEGKNILRYLPELKQKKPSKARKNTRLQNLQGNIE